MLKFIKKNKIVVYLVLIIFCALFAGGYILADWYGGTAITQVETAGRQGLVAHWTFDSDDVNGKTVYDKSGRGNTAVSNNTPSLVSGPREQAMMLNGTDDYLTVTQVSDFAWGTSQNFTIVLWYFSSTTAYTGYAEFVDAEHATPRWEVGINSANNLYAHTHDGTKQATSLLSNPSDGQWHQVAVVANRTGNLTLYLDVDTSNAASMTAVGNLTQAGPLSIGRNENNNNYFKDKIDDIRIYNRALSVAELRALYNDSKKNYVQSAPRNGLVGYWNMDDNDINGTAVYDKSGNGNNGTLANTPTTGADGRVKQAVAFDGNNEYIQVNDSSSLDISNEITISAWIYPRDTTTEYDVVVSKRWSADTYPWSVYQINRVANTQTYAFCIGDTNSDIYCSDSVYSAPLNQWTHLVGVFDGSQTIIYFNGQAGDPTSAIGKFIQTNNVPLSIGRNYYNREYYNGLIDEVRIYNRALSSSEVFKLYESAKINYIK